MKRSALLILLACSPALAQQQPQQPQQPAQPPEAARGPVDPATGRPATEPAPPAATETAEEAAARMFLTGSSLMQAQLAVQEQSHFAPPGIDPRTSWFAVPQPVPTVIRKHDLVTVVVREESSARSSGQTRLEKQAAINAALRDYIRLNLPEVTLEGRTSDARLRADAGANYEGRGTIDRRDSFVTRITAEVLDVKPNGTIVLQARKQIISDEEQQTFVLTGTCRTEDIGPDNTVLSTQLHDLNLEKHTRGALSDTTRRGFITRMLGRLNPF